MPFSGLECLFMDVYEQLRCACSKGDEAYAAGLIQELERKLATAPSQ